MTTTTQPPLSRRAWLLAALAEAAALVAAGTLWVLGFVAAPGFASPDTQGSVAAILALELTAAALCLLVPRWLARRTGRPAWWLVGVLPALGAVATGVALATGW